jgi:hypothetical protein
MESLKLLLNLKEVEKKMENPQKFLETLGGTSLKIDGEVALPLPAVLEAMRLYAAHVYVHTRHDAAEIALTVGSSRSLDEAHRDIMNLKPVFDDPLSILTKNGGLEKDSTDILFKKLPSVINIDGDFFGLKIAPTSTNKVHIWYESDDTGNLGNTVRVGKDLRDALSQMYDWLIRFGYIAA